MSPQHKNNSTNFKTSLQSITSAVTAMKGIKAGAYIGSNGLFDSATVNAYRASIKGLSATQAEAALSASGLNAAQRQQILTSKESTVANAGQATSFNVLTKAVWANVKAMAKWLVTTPTGWITLAIGATVGLITAYNNVEKKQNELIENARNLQEEYRSFAKDTAGKITSLEGQAEEFNKLAKGVDKYGNNISLASDEYDRYKSIVAEILGYSPELIQGYDAEGNAIADKNGLLERSIELLKEEQRLKLKEMTTDEKTGEAYDAAEAGWQQVQGYEGANTRNQIARWFDDNALRGGVNYEVDIAKVLGIKDEWKEEGNNLQNAIINNIDTVVKNIKDKKAELLAISDSDGNAIFSVDEIDSIIDLSNDWQYAYNQWQQDIEDAKHGMDDQFDLYAQRAKSYNDLTDAQKVFVNEYIRATGDITDAEGHLLSEDKILEKAKGYEKFVNEFAELNKLGEGGSVDLTFRPEIDTEELNKKGWEAGEGFATVFSSAISNTDFDDLIPENAEDTVAINFTPIIVDPNTGEFKGVLSEEELYAYAHDVLAGVREDDLNLQIGTKFEGKNAIDEAVADGERIHYLHEKLFINNDTVDSWEELRKVLVKTGDDAVQAGENANKMTVSLDDLKDASDSISTLASAFKELDEDGYITIETLSKIQEVTGLSGDEWDKYQSKLLNAKKGSAEFNQVLSDLTYKILENKFTTEELADADEDYIAAILRENGVINANEVAHNAIRRAKIETTLEAMNLANATGQSTDVFYEELKALGLAKTTITELADAYRIYQEKMTLATQEGVLKRLGLEATELEAMSTIADVYKGADLPENWEESGAMAGGTYANDLAKVAAYVSAKNKLEKLMEKITGNITPRYSNPSKESSDKNKPGYEDPTDAIINRINSQAEAIEKQKELLDHQMDMVDAEKDYAKAVELTNKAINNQIEEITARQKAQKLLSAEAQKIRNKYAGIDTNSFFDANGEFTEAYYSKYNSFKTKDEQELFASDMEALQKFKKAWFAHLDEIRTAEKSLYDFRIELQDMHYNHLESLVDELKHYYELAEEKAEDDKEYYDYLIAKEQALLNIRKTQYAIENNLYSARREAEKAIASSKIGAEYLDEDTRKLIYNEDDYKLEVEKIDEIGEYIEGLTEDYVNAISGLSEDEAYKAEEITAQYERRVALKEKELEILKAEIDLEKKQSNLNNILAEKNIRQIVNGKWEWTYDTDKARQAKEDVIDAESRLEQAKKEHNQLEHTNTMEGKIGTYELQKSAIDKSTKELSDNIDDVSKAIELLRTPVKSFNDIIAELKNNGLVNLNNSVNDIVSAFAKITNGNYSGSKASSSASVSSSKSSGSNSVVKQMRTNSTLWYVSDSATQSKLHSENKKLASSIGATYNSSDGKYYKNGKPLYDNGGILKGIGGIKATEKDEAVLSPALTSEILNPENNALFNEFASNVEFLLTSGVLKPLSALWNVNGLNSQRSNMSHNQNNNSGQVIHINHVDVHSPADLDGFVKDLTMAIKTTIV